MDNRVRECRGEDGGFSLGELCGDEGSSGSGLMATVTFARAVLEAVGAGEQEGRGRLRGGSVVAVEE